MKKEIIITVKLGTNVLGQFADLSFATTFVTGFVSEHRDIENFDIIISKRTNNIPEPKADAKPAPKAAEPKKVEVKKEDLNKKN